MTKNVNSLFLIEKTAIVPLSHWNISLNILHCENGDGAMENNGQASISIRGT